MVLLQSIGRFGAWQAGQRHPRQRARVRCASSRPSSCPRRGAARPRCARRVPRGRSSARCAAPSWASSCCSSPRSTAAWAAAPSTSTASASAWPRIDLGIATGVLATFLGSDPIARRRHAGAAEALDDAASPTKGLLMAYGATEPEAGSDLAALRTTADAASSEDGARRRATGSTGSKQWISNGGVADVYTDPRQRARRTELVRRRDAARPGFTHGKPEDKHGIRAQQHRGAVPRRRRTSTPTAWSAASRARGCVQAQAVFGYTRLMVAAFGLGAGWAALDRAIPYSRERIQAGGAALREAGLHAQADRAPRRAAGGGARLHRGDRRAPRRRRAAASTPRARSPSTWRPRPATPPPTPPSRPSAATATRSEYMVEKIKRDVRITTIYEGTSEIMEMTIARDRWQQHLKTRGQHYHDQARAAGGAARPPRRRRAPDVAALALHALAEVLERARLGTADPQPARAASGSASWSRTPRARPRWPAGPRARRRRRRSTRRPTAASTPRRSRR